MAAAPHFLGLGSCKKDRQVRRQRGQRAWEGNRGAGAPHAEAKHLDHSAQVLGLDLDGCGSLTWGEGGSWEELEARRWQEGAPRSQEGRLASWEEAGAG